jgi:hypothetical protein
LFFYELANALYTTASIVKCFMVCQTDIGVAQHRLFYYCFLPNLWRRKYHLPKRTIPMNKIALFVAILVVFNSIQTTIAQTDEIKHLVPGEEAPPTDLGQLGE